MILILYTTLYRKGGDKFKRVAKTMNSELSSLKTGDVVCVAVESKVDVIKRVDELKKEGSKIDELHFIGHSGMYGPMFGTVEYPEQFSPYEWCNLDIPFSDTSTAYFHCCRSARWFAPFFARTFNVRTFGFHWYTTFSRSKDKFSLDKRTSPDAPLYCFGHSGRKSHGYLGSLKKYLGLSRPEKMKVFEPEQISGDNYNTVADLYDRVFQDIRVRQDEWNWLKGKINSNAEVLDIGCGNGALLKQLSSKIKLGIGVDESQFILDRATLLNTTNQNLRFQSIDGPALPFSNKSFDLVISLLSFRYLDWDPMMNEINRVLKDNGRLLIIDMVTAPVKASEYFSLLVGKMKHYKHRKKYPQYYKALSELVSHPDWKEMLKYNPIRSEHEMKWFLESRFPSSKLEVINIGWNARVVAFEVKNISSYRPAKLTYP